MAFRKFDPYASYTPWNKWCLVASLSCVGYMVTRLIMSFFGATTPWYLHIPGLAAMLTVSYLSAMKPQWPLVARVIVGWTLALSIGFILSTFIKQIEVFI